MCLQTRPASAAARTTALHHSRRQHHAPTAHPQHIHSMCRARHLYLPGHAGGRWTCLEVPCRSEAASCAQPPPLDPSRQSDWAIQRCCVLLIFQAGAHQGAATGSYACCEPLRSIVNSCQLPTVAVPSSTQQYRRPGPSPHPTPHRPGPVSCIPLARPLRSQSALKLRMHTRLLTGAPWHHCRAASACPPACGLHVYSTVTGATDAPACAGGTAALALRHTRDSPCTRHCHALSRGAAASRPACRPRLRSRFISGCVNPRLTSHVR